MNIRALLLVLSLALCPSIASAQCSGIFPAKTVCGSVSGGLPLPLSSTQQTSLLNLFTASLPGIVPASGGGVTSFLRADGTWATTSNKTLVNGNLNVFVDPAGNDANNGTFISPWASCAHAVQVTQSTYDLQNNVSNSITINFNTGTYAFNGGQYCQLSGKYTGQISPSQVIFTATVTGTISNVVFQNTAGYGWGCNFGGQATVQWITVDGTSNNNDAFNITSGCSVIVGNLQIQHFLNPWNFFSITGAGTNVNTINGQTFGFKTQGSGVGTTGTWISSSTTITVASAAGLLPGMGVVAANSTIPYPCIASTIVGTTVTLNCNTTGSGSGTGLTFYYSNNAFISASLGASFYLNTNGDPNFATPVTFDGSPYFAQSAIFSSNLASVSFQAATFENNAGVIGLPYQISGGGIIDTGLQGPFYIPATQSGLATYATTTASTTSGSNLITVGSAAGMQLGMSIGGYASPTSTFSNNVSSIVVSANTNINTGNRINHRCIPGGTTVSSVVGTTIGLSHNTTCATSGAETVYFTGTGIGPNNTITAISGTTITLAQAATATIGSVSVASWGNTLQWGGNNVR